MEYRLLGWPSDGPTLELDYREFRYAGKFVMSSTGKLVAEEATPGDSGTEAPQQSEPAAEARQSESTAERSGREIVGATAFDEDRTDSDVLRIRYVTVRDDRQGEAIGTELLERTVEAGLERGYDAVRIAVNNPYAYVAATRAGFGYDGETTGIAELVLTAPSPETDRFRAGLVEFLERDVELSSGERSYVQDKLRADPAE